MARWLHFTEEPGSFELDPEGRADGFDAPGVFVYADGPGVFALRAAVWHQDAVLIECPASLAEEVEVKDEYFIPASVFARCTIIRAVYR